jgi:putative spermidine/putrescine transport system permease protein
MAPLLLSGVLAAGLLVLVRTVGMFELTFLTVGDSTPTMVVGLHYSDSSTRGSPSPG